MALTDPYISSDDLAEYLGISGTAEDDALLAAVEAASAEVTSFCGRDFQQTTTATARTYRPQNPLRVVVHDFHTTTDLVIKTDTTDDGTYDTTWAASDYILEPLNGMVAGVAGFPYTTIVSVETRLFPCGLRPRVQVTAQWGWAAVPAPVVAATKILAAEIFRLKDAPLGVAGFNEFGPIRVREVPQVATLLRRYQNPATTGPFVA